MKRLDLNKLFVEYRNVSALSPIIGRKYTQTHSDSTGNLFLTIALHYAEDKISAQKDHVLAEWLYDESKKYYLHGYVYVGGDDRQLAEIRYTIFMRELPLALAVIRNGDKQFFENNYALDQAPIYVYFDSPFSFLQGYRYFRNPKDYLNYYR